MFYHGDARLAIRGRRGSPCYGRGVYKYADSVAPKETTPPRPTLETRPPSLLDGQSLWLGAIVIIVGGFLAFESFRYELAAGRQLLGIAWAVLWVLAVLGFAVYRLVAAFAPSPPIVLEDDAILLPGWGPRPRRVPFSRIDGVFVRTAPSPALLLDVAGGTRVVDARRLRHPEVIGWLHEQLRARIAALPDGRARFEGMERALEVVRRVRSRPAWATRTIIAALLGLLVLELTLAQSWILERIPGDVLARLGANVPDLVRAGQLDRLVTANFLHGGALHLLMNGVAISSLGGILEPLLSRRRFVVLYLVTAVLGAAASTFAGHALSIGASTAAFGLFGGLATVQLRFRRQLPSFLFPGLGQWLYLLGVNAVISSMPLIDGTAHLGGFVGGVLVAFLLTLHRPPLDDSNRGSMVEQTLFVLVLAGTVAGLAASFSRAFG